jgi:hypothetical protein
MSFDRRRPRTAGKPGERRRNKLPPQWCARGLEMVESPAFRVLSLAAHRALTRIEIEHRHHGGQDNGRLPVTYQDFRDYGVHRHGIAAALRELEALGFIEITERGRGGNAEWRTPNKYRLTYKESDVGETNNWRNIETMEEAEQIARQARKPMRARTRQRNRIPAPKNAISRPLN